MLAGMRYDAPRALMVPALALLSWTAAELTLTCARRPAVGGSAPERMRVRMPCPQASWAATSDALCHKHDTLKACYFPSFS